MQVNFTNELLLLFFLKIVFTPMQSSRATRWRVLLNVKVGIEDYVSLEGRKRLSLDLKKLSPSRKQPAGVCSIK